MKAEITTQKVVAALRKIPEKRFLISELAPQLLDESGKVSVAKAVDRQPDVNLAIVEIQNYIQTTKAVRGVLSSIPGQRADISGGDFHE